MDEKEFLRKLHDYNEWFQHAANQKNVADKILDKCILDKKFILKMKNDSATTTSEFVSLWSNSHYHYGIGIENGLKALIIKYQPDTIKIEIKNDNVTLKNIGGNAGKSHNLLELAKTAGVFERTDLYHCESDFESLKRVLLHLSDMIRWGSRYPIPNNPSKIYKFDGAVPPTLVFGFHILDVLNPLFECFEREKDEDYQNR